MKRIGILTAGGDTPALNATIYGAVIRANQRTRRGVRLHQGLQQPAQPARAARPPQSAVHARSPSSTRRCGGTILGASRDYVDADDTATIAADRRPARAGCRIDGLICVGGDGTLNGMQALSRPPADRARPQDDRQRPRPELPQRAGRVDPRAVRRTPPGYRYARMPLADAVRPRPDGQLRDARLRHGRVRLGQRRRSASAPRPRAIAASPSSRSWAGTPATSPWAPPTASPTSILVPEHPAQRRPPGRARPGDLRPAEARRDRLRRGDRRRARAGAGRRDGARPTRPATRSSPAPPRPCGRSLIDRLGDTYFTSKRRNESARGGHLHP